MNIVDFAGIKVDNVSLDEAVAKVKGFLNSSSPHLIVTPNPEMIVAAQGDKELKEIINSASLRVPDGISLVVISRIIGNPLKERVTGIDLMHEIIKLSSQKGYKVFLLGSKPGVAQEAALKLVQQYPGLNIVGTHPGYFDTSVIVKMIKDTKPDILFVGLGMGRQEKWIYRYMKELNIPVAMAIGGSLDVISGRKKRAPKWIQDLYMEWLYRLITEPNRWKRQLALPKFLWLMFISRR